MAGYVIALDQGTTSSRCILFDRQGTPRSAAQKEFRQIYPKPGWVEHDPMELWSSQLSVMLEAMGKIGARYSDIAAIGITNQRETTVVWDKQTGQPVYNAIVWQCRRTAEAIEHLKQSPMGETIRAKTGLIPDAYFSGSKLAWILDHVEGARDRAERGELLFGTVDSWLIWNLTHGEVHVTDCTNASRTMLFDIHRTCWDQEILDYFRIPRAMLPQVRPSSCIYGYTSPDVTGGKIPIAGAHRLFLADAHGRKSGALPARPADYHCRHRRDQDPVRPGGQRVCGGGGGPVAPGRDAHGTHLRPD